MRKQTADRARPQQIARNPTERPFAKTAVAISADDDEIDILILNYMHKLARDALISINVLATRCAMLQSMKAVRSSMPSTAR